MPVSADPELALRLARSTVDVYSAAAADLLRTVARRLARGIDQPGWHDRRLAETIRLRDEAQAVVDRLAAETPARVEAALTEARAAGIRQAATDLRSQGLPTGGQPRGSIDNLAQETLTVLRRPREAILRTTMDTYRAVISETAGLPLTGARTRRHAAQAALNRFAMRGITGFRDRAGRQWQLESYTEMAMRTAVGRAQIRGALDRMTAAGHDLVIVSDAPGECETCRRWEGRVLSSSGTHPRYPSVGDAAAGGLWHPNCRHGVGAWVPGLSRQMGDTADPAQDAARQELRRLERGVRQWKRREAVALDDITTQTARRHIRQWQKRIREHTAETGLIRQRPRERLGAR